MSPSRTSNEALAQFENLEPRMLLDSQIGVVTMPFDGYLSAGIYDSNNQLIRTLLAREPEAAGTISLTWDGRDELGRMVTQNGNYTWKALVSQVVATDEGGVGDSSISAADPLADSGYNVQSLSVSTISGTGGEIGGTFARNDNETFFGDTTLSQSYNLNTAFSASGDFYASDFSTMGSALFGGDKLFVGHFSSSTADNRREFMGLEFTPGDASDRIGVQARMYYPYGDPVSGLTTPFTNIVKGLGIFHFSYSYDPNYEADAGHAGPEGRLTARIYNDSLSLDQTVYVVLSGGLRDYGSTYDAFGVGQATMESFAGDDPTQTAKVAIDNVTYSGNTGTEDFNTDPTSRGWTGVGNNTSGNSYGWTTYSNADGGLYSSSYLEESAEIRKIGADGSSRWTSWDALDTGIAADEKYAFVIRHEDNQDRLYRYTARDGGPAQFGTYPDVKYIVINSNAPDTLPADRQSFHYTAEEWRNYASCWGMAADGYRLWISNYRTNSLSVYDRNTGALLGSYSLTKPLGIALDTSSPGSATVWVANSGDRLTKITYNGSFSSSTTITGLSDPTGVAIGGPSHHLFVAESGSNHIHEYDISSTPVLAGLQTFGSQQTGIDVGPSTFNWPGIWGDRAALAVDPSGILNVTDDHRIQRFYTTTGGGHTAGDLYQSILSEFCPAPADTSNYASNGMHYLDSGRYRYEVDPEWTGGPRAGWMGDGSWRLIQRVNVGIGEDNYSGLRRNVAGHELFYEILGNTVVVYTVSASGQRQAAIVGTNWNGPDRMNSSMKDANGNYIGGRYTWTDTDGDGVVDWNGQGIGQDGEVKWDIPNGQASGIGYSAPYIDDSGNIYFTDGNSNLIRVPLDGFDTLGNPRYDWAHRQTVITFQANDPYGFAPLTVRVAPNGDIYALGNCANAAIDANGPAKGYVTSINGGYWIARFDSAGNRLMIEPTRDRGFAGIGIDDAAYNPDYFVAGGEVWAKLFTKDGLLVDKFMAGPASGGPVGWMDQTYSITAFTNPFTGQLYVYGEEVFYGKSVRWRMDNMNTIQRTQGTFSYTNPNDLAGHWEMDSSLADAAGVYTGSYFGGASPTYTAGHAGNAISLDGVDDYVKLPFDPNLTGYTIAGWIKPTTVTNANIISRTDGWELAADDEIRINNGKFEHVTIDVNTTKTVTGTTSVVAGNWYYVAITASAGGMARLYVNGAEQGTAVSISGLWNGGDRFLVGKGVMNTGFFNGLVDDLRVFEGVLSSSDISALYTGSSGVALPRVSVIGSDITAAEQSQDRGVFTIKRDGAAGNLTVNYTISGTASNGTDYSTVSSSVVIANGQTSATVTVTPIDDGAVDPNETVVLTITSSANYSVGSASSATMAIVDNDSTAVTPNTRWMFNNNLYDYIGHNTGDLRGQHYWTDPMPMYFVPGLIGKGMSLAPIDPYDGYADWVEAPYATDGSSYTITAWIKADDATGVNVINRVDGSASPTIISDQIRINYSGKFEHYTYDGTGKTVTGTTVAQPGTWYFVAIVASNNGMARLYVNGQEEGTAVSVGTLWTGGDRFEIGKSTNVGGSMGLFDGLVDDIQVFDAPLSGSQISAIYAQTCAVSVVATDPSAAEQSANTGTFTVTRTTSSGDLTVNYVVGGSATSGSDFSALSGSVVIANGQTSATVTITPIDDSVGEGDEIAILSIVPGNGYWLGSPSSAIVTVADNEPAVSVVATDASAAEQGADVGTFTVTRTTSTNALTVYYTLTGTATNGSDYSSLSGSVVIANGQTSATVTVTPIDDSTAEVAETVMLTVSTNANYSVGKPGNAAVTIADNEPVVTIAATDSNASEQGADTATFTITRTTSTNTLTVYYTASGTGTSGSDYSTLSGSVVIANGQTSATVTITPIDDAVYDPNETVVLTLTANANYTNDAVNSATAMIADNDVNPNSVAYLSTDTTHQGTWKGVYGSSGYSVIGDAYSLPSGVGLSVDANTSFWAWTYSTSDVRAPQKPNGSDRIAACWNGGTTWSMTVDFGSTTRQFALYMVDWDSAARNTTVDVLDGATGAILDSRAVTSYNNGKYLVYQAKGLLTFRFDYQDVYSGVLSAMFWDPAAQPSVTVAASDPNAAEPSDTGTFTITRTTNSGALTVNYTVGGTATSASDFSALSGSVVIADGQTSAAVTVTPIDDSTAESTETVVLTLSTSANYNVGAPNAATVNIADNEATVTVTASDASASEQGPDTGAFMVSRTNTSGNLTVYYTVGGTATSASDFSALSGSVVISSGQSSAAVTVTPIDDSTAETSETVVLTVSTNANYTVGTPNTATVNIADNEPAVSVTATDANAAEQGQDTGTFTVTRTNANGNLTVYYTVGGTATSASDFSALSGSVVISSGQTSATVTVTPIDDSSAETAETVVLTLSTNAGYTVGSPSNATVNIADNEATVSVNATDANASEQGADPGTFTVTRTTSSGALTVYYTVSGTATSAADYSALSGSVVIANGQTTATVTVTPIDDASIESSETVIVTLTANAAYAVGTPNNATVSIADNDAAGNTVSFQGFDTATQGTWNGVYGGDGYVVMGGSTSLPTGVTLTNAGASFWTWANPTTDVRAPQNTNPATSRAACAWFGTNGTWSITVDFGSTTRQFALYMLDFGNTNACSTTLDVLDGQTQAVLDSRSVTSYSGGKYVIYQAKGLLTFRFNMIDVYSPAVSAIFFDAAAKPTISINATDANASETGGDTGTFTVTRTTTSGNLTVNYTVGGTATSASDFSALSGSVVIPSGQTTATVTVTAIDDALAESSETVTVTLSTNASYTVGTPNNAAVTIADNEPTVSVIATDASAAEPSDTGTFTLTRTNSTNALTVFYTVTGTATSGSDFSALSGSVVIANGQTSATVTVTPIDDAAFESTETVTLALSTNSGYFIGSPASDTVSIADNETTVTVAATDANAAEQGADTGTFTVTRTSTTGALTVYYTVGGTATSASDFSALSGSVVISAGQTSATVTVTPIDDSTAETTETVLLTISTNASYAVGTPNNATVNIADNEPTVTIAATDSNAAEQGQDTGTFTVTRTTTSGALTVYYTVGGTATSASDFSALSGSVVIANGQSSATVTVTPIDDSVAESSETVALTLSTNSAYNVGSPNTATVNIADNEPLVTINATDASAAEAAANTGTFTVTRTTSSGALTVYYTVGGTATSGSDFSALAGSVVIASGQTSATITVTPIDDSSAESTETVVVTLTANASYTVDTPSSATVNIADNDSAGNTVTYITTDTTHQGTWKGVYGADGYYVVDAGTFVAPPGVTVTPSGNTDYVWTWSTTDVRALQKPDPANDRIAAAWFGSAGTWSITVDFGTTTRQFAMYMLDWGNTNQCSTTLDVLDGQTQAVLDSRQVSAYMNGKYLVYQGKGLLTFRFKMQDVYSPVVNGFFFDPVTSVTPSVSVTATDSIAAEPSNTGQFTITRSTTSGNLTVNYTVSGTATSGSDFSALAGSVVIPNGQTAATVTVTPLNDSIAENDETVTLTLSTNANYTVSSPSNATVTINDDDFVGNSVIYLSTDTTTKGTWKGVYGTDGYCVIGASQMGTVIPNGVSVTANGADFYAWTYSTSDTRAPQKPDSDTDRVAAAWMGAGGTTWSITVNFGATTRQFAMYMLDWSATNAANATVDVLDGQTGAVLDTKSMSDYSGGKYLVYQAKGTLTFRFNKIDVYSPVISAFFFDPVSIATDTFETGAGSGGTGWGGNWSLTGNASIVNTGTPKNGSYHMQLTGNNGVASRAVNLAGYTSARLVFDWKANSFEAGETAVVEIYNGTSWITVQTISDGQDDNVYHHSDIDLSSYSLTASFQVRFRSLMSAADDYFYVDNLFVAR